MDLNCDGSKLALEDIENADRFYRPADDENELLHKPPRRAGEAIASVVTTPTPLAKPTPLAPTNPSSIAPPARWWETGPKIPRRCRALNPHSQPPSGFNSFHTIPGIRPPQSTDPAPDGGNGTDNLAPTTTPISDPYGRMTENPPSTPDAAA
ncbi:hypothetical protein MKZ38_007011 [Zalerion maritima]|uniref:Uncharacterized protein n=1 Tax=Zalerion maritima TaxID=339359 RepID=A0AAD5RI97_9PEZI|nr:hypothetical protein MKZ38_007011 [Zalerion maritima]